MYYIYILRCHDDSLYTGITTNIQRRLEEHLSQGKKAAKYTRTHQAEKIVACWSCENRKQASKLEYHIKKLNKKQKELLIQNQLYFLEYFKDKIEIKDYQRKEFV